MTLVIAVDDDGFIHVAGEIHAEEEDLHYERPVES